MKLNLDPMTAMLAVVGDMNRPGSIVLAASPALKNKYGISNVSRFFELPHDPNIYIIQAHMADYIQASLNITKLLMNYAPKEAIHVYSIDETWITINGLKNLFGDPWQIAQLIKQNILREFGLTCSIGIGDNKFLAKVIMDVYAKKSGIAECRYEHVKEKLWPLPVEKIWGIGSRMKDKLNQMGIETLGSLAHTDIDRLKRRFGVMGEQIYWHAWGIDLSPVYGNFLETEQKGFGHGITLLRDYSAKEISTCILDLCEEVCNRARAANKVGKTIHLSIAYADQAVRGFNRSKSMDVPTNLTPNMYEVCMHLFHTYDDGKSKVRRVYVTLDQLFDDGKLQLNLFENESKKKDILYVMDEIKNKYGSTAILRASSYTNAGIALDRSKKIGGHYT